MTNVKLNVIANYAGSIWTAVMGVVFVPLYIRFMGIESYGLVGFFGALIAMFSILDMGLSATMNREMARRSATLDHEQTLRDLLRTVEIIYWSTAVLVGSAVIALSYPIARYWINAEKLSVAEIWHSVMIMGIVIGFRWPLGMYQGGLRGLQKQVLVNILNVITGTLRGLGAVLVLWLVSPSIQAFFCWQVIVSVVETFTSAYFLWCSLPTTNRRPKFQKAILIETWRFACGIGGTNLVNMLLKQSDKIILSKMLNLEVFAYYMLAWTVARSIDILSIPISLALFPSFSKLVYLKDTNQIKRLYHAACQLNSALTIPVSMVLCIFSYQVIVIWTGDPNIAERTSLLLSLLIIGTAVHLGMVIPYCLQLAYGWTSLGLLANSVATVLLIPMLVLSVETLGILAGAVMWITLNLGHLFIIIPIMHSRILRGEMIRWYFSDFLQPIIVSLLLVNGAKLLFNPGWSVPSRVGFMLGVAVISSFSVLLVSPVSRSALLANLHTSWNWLKLKTISVSN